MPLPVMIQIVLIVLLIALAVLVALARKNPGNFNIPIGIVIALTIVALILKVTVFKTTEVKMVQRYAAAVGYTLGQKVGEKNPRKIIVIQYPDYDITYKGRAAAQMKGFMKGLGDNSVEIEMFVPQAKQSANFDPEEGDDENFWYEQGRWRRDFITWYREQNDNDVDWLVSFAGFPQMRTGNVVETLPNMLIRHTGRRPVEEMEITTGGKLKGYVALNKNLTSQHKVGPTASLDKVFKSRYIWRDL